MNHVDAVKKLYFWKYQRVGTFHDLLFDLFQKDDGSHLAQLQQAFPAESIAFIKWQRATDYGDDLFRQHGLIK